MSKEQQELLNVAYENYSKEYEKDNSIGMCLLVKRLDGKSTYRKPNKEMFVDLCTYDKTFSEKWGLKIEERELSFEERWDLSEKYGYRKKGGEIPSETETFNGVNEREEFNSMMNDPVMGANLPTKLITITYNDKTIESYE
jgi:hypothetical protein